MTTTSPTAVRRPRLGADGCGWLICGNTSAGPDRTARRSLRIRRLGVRVPPSAHRSDDESEQVKAPYRQRSGPSSFPDDTRHPELDRPPAGTGVPHRHQGLGQTPDVACDHEHALTVI